MDATRAAWETFCTDGTPAAGVSDAISASWQRSREYGVVPDADAAPWAGRSSPLAEPLRKAGMPAIRDLAAELDGSRSVVVMTDATGMVVGRAGERTITRRTDAGHMVPGAGWSERAAGTNAISLALVLEKAVVVQASEHWCEPLHDFACTAVPITDPATRRTAGVITLITRAQEHDGAIAAALLRRTARDLVRRLHPPPTTLRDIEREAIFDALEATNGDVSAAARRLQISRATVHRKLRDYRLLD